MFLFYYYVLQEGALIKKNWDWFHANFFKSKIIKKIKEHITCAWE